MIKLNQTLPLTLVAAALLQSCGKEEPLKSSVCLANMNTLVKPGNDFDAY